MRLILPFVALSTIALPAMASSDLAWRQLQQRAERKCIGASGYLRPRVSNAVVFSDANGKVALLVTGGLRGVTQRGVSVTSLCLFDRRTDGVELQEAEGWRDRRP